MSDNLAAKADILDLLHRFTFAVDGRDYVTLRSCLTPEVNFDYSALGRTFSASANILTEQIQEGHRGIDGIQHVTTNHVIQLDGGTACCDCNFIAHHLIHTPAGDVSWSLGGRYTYQLDETRAGWKIAACKIHVSWTSGDRAPFTAAQVQAKANLA